MFTRCPHCQAVHALNARLLSTAGGKAVCGQCQKPFSAVRHLFDDYPEGPDTAPDGSAGEPPVLGEDRDVAPAPAPALAENPPRSRLAWRLTAVLLVGITLLNVAWTFREASRETPWLHDRLVSLGLAEPEAPFRDPSRIHIVSRDLHAHPSRGDVLVLSATFVNLADQSQPYPELVLTLKDQDNRPLAGRVFRPREYLREGFDAARLLQPGSHVPILLEFSDPGEDAVGFELAFH